MEKLTGGQQRQPLTLHWRIWRGDGITMSSSNSNQLTFGHDIIN